MRQFLVIALPLLCCCFCSPPRQAIPSRQAVVDSTELQGNWRVTSLPAASQSFDELFPGRKPQINFDLSSSTAAGFTGCNTFSTTFAVQGSSLRFRLPVTSTRMACAGSGEKIFLETLQRVDLWVLIDSTTLNFISGTEPVARLTRE